MSDDAGEALGALFLILLVLAAIAAIIFILMWVAGIMVAVGAAVGSGHAFYNYGRAFYANVRLER
uniref:Uncharacterized protein n=1 Tax=Candidatus Kentrum sp. MB TaxID=2138164 RepID=A0A450XFN8_9GAMM|nr:MAG: hypothetical protein BECKMB1821G_GA0114241_10333 [Candidatus Kentron sp. MB]